MNTVVLAPRALMRATGVVALLAGAWMAQPVQASTQVACLLAGKVGVAGHLDICDHVVVHAMTMVSASITEPGEYSAGIPAQPTREWRKNAVRIRQLDSLARRVTALGKGEE